MANTFPADFVKILRLQYGEGEAEALLDALLSSEPTTTIRLNPLHSSLFTFHSSLPWCPLGRVLPTRPRFILDPLLHSGAYYVQEAASMFLWHAMTTALQELNLSPTLALDLCAAPGGKSTLALSLLSSDCLLVANETIAARTGALVENICKWGYHNVVVTSAEAKAFAALGPVFDVIIADVPCSGEGMFRKNEEAVRQWTREKVARCQGLQREIVAQAWQALKPGGLLIYSTCTFNPLEDEDNVSWICEELGGETLDLRPSPDWHILPAQHSSHHAYHFLPHRTMGEGFFLSAIKAPQPPSDSPRLGGGQRLNGGQTAAPTAHRGGWGSWVLPEADITLDSRQRLCLFPRQHLPIRSLLYKKGVKILQEGIPFAERKGRDKWSPLQPLAHSPWLNAEAFPQVELTTDEALNYLRGQALTLPIDTPRGYALVCYQGHRLGFVNNIGTRANNLYPAAWRIRNA